MPSADAANRPDTRTYVLDTSVLLSDPYAITKFAEHEVVIPLVVITELEAKREHPLLGFTAREALRGIDAATERGEAAGGSIHDGVPVTDEGGTLRIEINHIDQAGLPDALAKSEANDARILAVANNLATDTGRRVTVISKDMPMRLFAKILGLGAEEYRNEKVIVSDAQRYTGMAEVNFSGDLIDALYDERSIDLADLTNEDTLQPNGARETLTGLPANTGVILTSQSSSALAIVRADKTIEHVRDRVEAFGITGKSAEQKIALDHLLNPEIGVVSLGGLAGSGKTALAIAAGLEQVMERRLFTKVVVFRPMYAVGGQEMGYLPGSAEEKMGPWAAAVSDALEGITSKEVIEEVTAQGLIEVQPLTYLRGRTLHDAFVIVDEAQSLEKPVLLTALTRLGKKSKIVLTHDVAQRDNLRVGRHDGVSAVIERLKGEPLFAHVTFTKSERSAVAAMATRLLDFEAGI